MGVSMKAATLAITSVCLVAGLASAQITQIGTSLNITTPVTVPLMAGKLICRQSQSSHARTKRSTSRSQICRFLCLNEAISW